MDSLRRECLRRQRVVKSLRTVSGLGITQREEEGSGVEARPVSYLAVHTSHAQGGAAGSLLGLIRPKSRRHMAGPSRSRAQLLLRAHSYPPQGSVPRGRTSDPVSSLAAAGGLPSGSRGLSPGRSFFKARDAHEVLFLLQKAL